MKVLMVMSDPEVEKAMSLCFGLYFPQATLLSSTGGAEAIKMLMAESPDVVVLDLMPPDMDGFELLSQVRALSNAPLLVVTPRGEEMERVRGLDLGADDYIAKPFSSAELVARVRAVLRRTSLRQAASHQPVDQPGFAIDTRSRAAMVHGQHVSLSPIEYRLLCLLASNIGRTLSQEELLAEVWGQELRDSSVLRVQVHRLRHKLGDCLDDSQIIITVPGKGYRFNLPVD
jgi:DNA-binding response OmpR family regulator